MNTLRVMVGLLQDDYDPNQPRDADGKFAKKTVGPVGQYKDLDPKHLERIIKAREDAVDTKAREAEKEVLSKHGYQYAFQAPQDVAQLAWDASIRVKGSELSTEKDEAEKEERDRIDQELEDERAIQSATAAGHLHPMPTKALSKFQDHAIASADELEKLGKELHASQTEAASAIKTLRKLDIEEIGDDESELQSPLDDDDLLEQLGSIASKTFETVNGLRASAALNPERSSSEPISYTKDDEDEKEVDEEDRPEYIAPDDRIEDPDKDEDYADSRKDPETFDKYCAANKLDPNEDTAQDDYEAAVAAHEEYLTRKEEFKSEQETVRKYDSWKKSSISAQRAQALVAQTALEKVYAQQTALVSRIKEIKKEHDKLLQKAQDEVPDEGELVVDSAFDGKANHEGEFANPSDREAYDDATRAAGALSSAESARRENVGTDFDELTSELGYRSDIAKSIKKLSAITGRPSSVSKAKAKAKKPTKSADQDDDEDDQEESISSLVSSLKVFLT